MSLKYIYFNSHNKEAPYCYLSPNYFVSFKVGNLSYNNVTHFIETETKSISCNQKSIDVNQLVYQAYYEMFSQNKDLLYLFKRIGAKSTIRFVYANAHDNVLGIGFTASDAPSYKPKWGQNIIGNALTKLYAYFITDK